KVQSETTGTTEPIHKGRRVAAVELGPPDLPATILGPIHEAPGKVQSETRLSVPADEDSLPAAIEIGPPDVPCARGAAGARAPIAPIHLAACKIQNWPDGVNLLIDEGRQPRAVEVGPLDGPVIRIAAVEELGPGLAHCSKKQQQSR